ncbi:kelch-like protein 26 isoform X2 [Styela clava]
MFKGLRGLKLTSKKKQEDGGTAGNQEGKKTKPPRPVKPPKHKVPALKKFKETMGNLTPSMFHGQHYIENIEEHATKVLAELELMRQNETLCDVTVTKCDGTKMKAHKIVVSFNEKLLQMTMQPSEETERQVENDVTYGVHNKGFNENGKEETTSPIMSDDEVELNHLQSVTSENDLVKGLNGDDVITRERPASPEQMQTDNMTLVNGDSKEVKENKSDEVENKKDDVTENSDDVTETQSESNKTETDVNGTETEESKKNTGDGAVTENGETETPENTLSSSLVEELTTPTSEQADSENADKTGNTQVVSTSETTVINGIDAKSANFKRSDTCDVTIEGDDIISPTSFEDPLEVIINFFYTSHINITRKNVTKLQVVARQCGLDDVTMACDEFENVLRTETESMETPEEKDAAASQFRYQYSEPTMAVKMLEHFEKLRSHTRHTDVIVNSPNTSLKFPAHTVLLVASSKFFAEKLVNCNDVIKTDVTTDGDVTHEVQAPDYKDSILQGMLHYFYTAKVSVTSHNVRHLMDAASSFKCSDVIEGCAEYLERTISVQNCIEIQSTAEKYDCSHLKNVAVRFIEANFLAVAKTKEFLTVTGEWISSIVSSQRLTVDFPASESEYQIFEAIRKWVNHDLVNRKAEVNEVMANVRIPLISDQHLINDISTDLLIMENDALCNRISGIVTGKSACKFDEHVAMRGEREFVLMIGGSAPVVDETSEDRGYTAVAFSDYVTMCDVKNGQMNELTYLPETRSLHCALMVDHYVIIAGGFDKYSCITNEVYALDLATMIWNKLPNMKVKRGCFTLQYLDGYIYAVGGLTPTGYSNKVERYNRSKMKWEYVAQLPRTYYRHGGCVYHGEIIITGGNDKSTDTLKYTPSSDSWRPMKPMNQGRDSHAMATALDKVYVLGGDIKILSVEEYNSSSECWQLLPFMYSEPVYLPGVTVLNDKIYLIGGWRGDDDGHDDVKCFDPATETWTPMMMFLPFPRGSLSATVVQLPRSYVGKFY